ncbi:PQQ-dependent sugar dehydrogenase [Alteromonas abrolhosensis]|uniref:PQQ-dependent sugar dehydrogenase n=1 Tax=Alteromonas abrolhosensis TaxID=1892904 RepID=UPI0035136818
MKSWRAFYSLLVLASWGGALSPAFASNTTAAAVSENAPSKSTSTQQVDVEKFAQQVVTEDVIASLLFPKAIATVIDKSQSKTHILIVTRDGELVIVDNKGESKRFPLMLDNLYTKGQGGVLDILIPSQFPDDSNVLLSYSKGSDSASRLAVVKGQLSLTSGITNLQPVLEVAQTKDTPVHYGGKLLQLEGSALGATHGFLVTTGDGFDYREQAQVISSQLGKVLGFTIDGEPLVNHPFPENPFIFTVGHRNPQGLVQGNNGQIFLHEHGPDGGDEVNLLQQGANYGWPVVTLGKDYSGARISPFKTYPGMTDPIVNWTPSIAPSSMLYYTDSQYPMLTNSLLVTSLKAKALYVVKAVSNAYISSRVFDELGERLRDIAVDHNGNILLLTDSENARVIKLSPKED